MGIGTFVALIPPIVAIVLCLLSKEVNLSLAAGVAVGALIYCGFDPFTACTTILTVGGDKVGGNFSIIVFLILLGMMVALMNMSGATHRYAEWASKRLRTKKSSLLATMALGIIVFMDDYFSCLTVGTVMRPITDTKKVSREKLAYIIDSTAAPICIIAPVSSWAAAVSSSLPEGSSIDGFGLFLQTIPANFYAILSLIMVFIVIVGGYNMGAMRADEAAAADGSYVYSDPSRVEETGEAGNGRIIDLVLPVLVLIFMCLLCMLYTGGLFEGENVADAFANCDAMTGLAMGSIFSVLITALIYLPRKVVTGKQFLDCLVSGTKLMVSPILILFFAWTLSAICGADYLNAGGYVGNVLTNSSLSMSLVPCIFFVVGLGLAFATGTSWGTFAILLPIGVTILGDSISSITVISCAAILGGAVCGDHLSPISDTTIMSSTGAECVHVKHVSTQLPYGITVATASFIGYLIAGFTLNYALGFVVALALLLLFVLVGSRTFAKPLEKAEA